MSNDLEKKVQRFLEEKPSYLKCSPKVISKYSGANNIKLCKRVKAKVNKALNGIESRIKEDVVEEFSSDFMKQFQEVADKLGFVKKSGSKTLSQDKAIYLPAKQNRYDTVNPSIPDQVGMHILMGCNHVPFHNEKMHRGMLEFLSDYKKQVKGFHLMGDFLDLNTLSYHDRGKFTAVPGLTLDDEYEVGNNILDEYDAILHKDTWKTYLYGNHEDRWTRWMKVYDNSKTPLASPTDALRLWERGYQVKDRWSQDYFTLGKHLDIFHGIYFSIHCAKAHMDKLRGSCAFVHTHRIQQYIEGNMGSFNIGAGADFNSPAFNYMPRAPKSSWQNGFAVVMIDSDGSYNLTQIICRNGHFYFGGKKYGN